MEEFSLNFTRMVASRHCVEYLTYSPSGHLLAATFGDYTVRLYKIKRALESYSNDHLSSLELLVCFKGHTSNVWCLSFNKDGSTLCSCSSDGHIIIYNIETLSITKSIQHHSSTIWSVKYFNKKSPELIITANEDSTLQIISPHTSGVLVSELYSTEEGNAIESLDVTSDDQYICTAGRDGRVYLWNTTSLLMRDTNNKRFLVYSCHQPIKNCQFISLQQQSSEDKDCNKDEDCIVFSSPTDSHSIYLYRVKDILMATSRCEEECNKEGDDVKTNEALIFPHFIMKGHCNTVWRYCTIISSQKDDHHKRHLLSCSGDKTIRFWDLSNGACLHVLRSFVGSLDPNSQILSCCISNNEEQIMLAVGTYDGMIYMAIDNNNN